MRRTIILALALLCWLAAGGLAFSAWQRYQAERKFLPPGTLIAGVAVGGLDTQAAGLRLAQVYALTPVELRYQGARVQIDPLKAGLVLHLDGMLAQAVEDENGGWTFSDYLFNQGRSTGEVPLQASLDAEMLSATLRDEIAPIYTQSPLPARPSGPGEITLVPGSPGQEMDVAAVEKAVQAALLSPDERVVEVPAHAVAALPPRFSDLGLVLEAVLQGSGFDGVAEIYLQDVESGQEIQIAYAQGRPVAPGIAFTAASTIKIPVLVSAFKQVEGELSPGLRGQMEQMIDLSDNGSTDEVMQAALASTLAPLQVTNDLRALGFENTFLAGFFYPGAPLLDRFDTPANTRTDVTTDPDVYNQTTPAEIGRLLAAIELCAAGGKGPLIATFNGQVTQAECQLMVAMLKNNRKAVLIENGVPEGTPLGHKYGWVTDFNDGLMHTASDAAIVYTPGGRFVLSIYFYHAEQLHWEPAQRLTAYLTAAAYNWFTFEP